MWLRPISSGMLHFNLVCCPVKQQTAANSKDSALPENTTPATASSAPDKQAQRLRHPLRFRKLQVEKAERIAPHFMRITLSGAELKGFASPGFDDHVKLVFPDAHSGEIPLPTIDADGKPVWPEGNRPTMRDYTPLQHDAANSTLVIDFAIHKAGPATAWALNAKAGDGLGVGGPRGSFIISPEFEWHLLMGDETAVPAINRRLAELPSTSQAIVLIEVEGDADHTELQSAASLQVHWCHRAQTTAGTSTALLDQLAQLTLPTGDGYAWIACETLVARTLRSHLVEAKGIHPKRIKAAGYWRRGAVASHDSIEE